jgi:hypothetical protein
MKFRTGPLRGKPCNRELPRKPLLVGAWVNKAGQASSAARSDYTRGCCRYYLRLHWFLLLAMLARQVLRTVHNYQDDRHHAPQRSTQPG